MGWAPENISTISASQTLLAFIALHEIVANVHCLQVYMLEGLFLSYIYDSLRF